MFHALTREKCPQFAPFVGLLILCLGCAASLAAAADAPPPNADSKLPQILIIGDSISMGYTPFVKEMMKGKAEVVHPRENCAATVVGLKDLSAWLGDTKWEVIHFNWGLHDLKHIDDKGNMTAVEKGKQWVPVEEYEKNLNELASRLEKTGAKLVWATTTPVPEGAKGRIPADVIKYNEAAERVMKAHHIPTDDLNAVAMAHLDLQNTRDVHYKPAGYRELAKSVVMSIEKVQTSATSGNH
jgi:acyl-CoA thioesterase-1